MWKTSVYASGVDVDDGMRAAIERVVGDGLRGLKGGIGHVHVRVYGDLAQPGLYTCYVRVDALPAGGVALGATAAGVEQALSRAVARTAAALRHQQGRSAWPAAGGLAYAFLK